MKSLREILESDNDIKKALEDEIAAIKEYGKNTPGFLWKGGCVGMYELLKCPAPTICNYFNIESTDNELHFIIRYNENIEWVSGNTETRVSGTHWCVDVYTGGEGGKRYRISHAEFPDEKGKDSVSTAKKLVNSGLKDLKSFEKVFMENRVDNK